MEKELRILMLEDLEEDAGLVESALHEEKIAFVRKRVDDLVDFTEALDNFKPDVILSDHSLHQFNSIEALKICQSKHLNIPFILVTEAVSEEFAVNCLKRGADDYVLLSNLSRLPLAIHHALRQHHYEHMRKDHEKALRQQNEELTKINAELDVFVYSISHNLRSPLASVLGLVNIAKLDVTKSNQATDHYLTLIEKSIHKLDHTLKEILNYSQNARSQVDISEINIKELIHQCLEQTNYLDGFNGVEKKIDIWQEATLFSNPFRISSILASLLSNAIKYQDTSKAKCYLNITASINPQSATICVQDNGIGIHREYLTHVFDMFYRGTERSDGAGLGLYIAKEMTDKLGGTLSISSTVGKETLAVLTIPNQSGHLTGK